MSLKNELFRTAYDVIKNKERVIALFDYIENVAYKNIENPYRNQQVNISKIWQINGSLKFQLYFICKKLKNKLM